MKGLCSLLPSRGLGCREGILLEGACHAILRSWHVGGVLADLAFPGRALGPPGGGAGKLGITSEMSDCG